MPITLGCPSCAKRFRARDESAGKKVKCPYCQAAVQVPSADDFAPESGPVAPPAPLLTPPAPPVRPPSARAAAAPVPSTQSGDWGALPKGPAAAPPPSTTPEPVPRPTTRGPVEKEKERPKPAKTPLEKYQESLQPSPESGSVSGWKRVRRGLGWVQFALFWLALIGFVGFGKIVYTRATGNPLPKGDGTEWISIEGFVNSKDPNSIPLSKEQIIDLACYGVPILLAGLLMTIGRLIASGGPRMSGSRGLFAASSLFGFLAFLALLASVLFADVFQKEVQYTREAFVVLLPLSEFWFVIGLTACGLALKRPGTARAVGMLGFLVAIGFAAAIGWKYYLKEVRPMIKVGPDDLKLYEQAAFMIGWLLLIVVYSRSVRNVRVGVREYMDTVQQ